MKNDKRENLMQRRFGKYRIERGAKNNRETPGFFRKMLVKVWPVTGTEAGLLKLKEIKQNFIIVGVALLLVFQIAIGWIILREMGIMQPTIHAEYEKNVAVLTIDQAITDGYIMKIIDSLEQMRAMKEEFAHLLVIMRSGGGSPQGSSELANYLQDLQEEIPVTMYVEGMAASGAYYIASAIKHDPNDPLSGIIANENSIIANIGVILSQLNYKDAADKLGIKQMEVTVGEYKSPISPWKELDKEGETYLKEQLMIPVYNNFLKFVANGRGMSLEELKPLADGRVYVATECVGTLVDRISYLTQIKREIKQRMEERFPEQEVGFTAINTKGKGKSVFSVNFNIENVSLGSDVAEKLSASNSNFNIK
jgi:protease-4